MFFTGRLEKKRGYLYRIFMRFLCFFSILIFFLVSCNSDSRSFKEFYEQREPIPQNQNENNGEKYIVMTSEDFEDSVPDISSEVSDILKGVMDCESCPLSLGYLIEKDVLDQSPQEDILLTDFCQGYLLEKNLFLVPSYCLPENVQLVDDSCENEIYVILPQINGDLPIKVLRCEQLVDLPSTKIDLLNNNFQLDWAALRLKDKAPERFTH